MEKNEIEYYLNYILKPKLVQLKVSENYIIKIITNIKNQIYSLLKHWNNAKFRETILLIGLEEGKFYKPENASIKVKCFVVVTIRNSLLETIASVDYKQAGLEKYIEDEEVISITMEAVNYFNSVNLRKVSEKLDYTKCDDMYYKIENTYKLAWKALNELAFCTGEEKYYDKIENYNKLSLSDLKNAESGNLQEMIAHVDYQSGISPNLSNELLSIIKQIINSDRKYFFTDCFKITSRNMEKLFRVIEILLQRNKVFLTNNYYIANNYVAKRTKILRAAHTRKEIETKMKQYNNLSKIHTDALEKVARGIG